MGNLYVRPNFLYGNPRVRFDLCNLYGAICYRFNRVGFSFR
jgi:hypothetical protein